MQTNQELSQMSHTALIDALIGANEIIEDLSNRLDKAEESAEALLSALEKTELELKTVKEQSAKLGEINSRYQFMQLVLAQYRGGLLGADDLVKKITAYDDKGWEIVKGASNEQKRL
nr:hypothetical protein [uncultured Campylobacter sp.]